MKVAIIGANGFVGTRLLEMLYLGDCGVCPVPIVRRPAGLAPVCRFEVPWRLGDALDEHSLTAALEGCEAVVHAAIGDPRQIEAMPALLCAASKRAGIQRLVYLSSASVHGQAPSPGTDETSPLNTGQALEYNNAKVRAERSFFEQCGKLGLEGFALRPGVVYGPRSRWISDLATDLREGRAWLLDQKPAVLNSIYIDNLCHAILQCLRGPAATTGAYLVGDPDAATWTQFTHTLAHALGVSTESIHSVSRLPDFTPSKAQQFKEAVAGPFAQKLLPLVPGGIKQGVKRLLASAPAAANAWSLPSRPAPRITQELALLQQCQWRFPHTKAEKQLGYQPTITFEEGLQRSLQWLAFAEGRPC